MGDSSDPVPYKRNANGQFMRERNAMSQDSIISVIVSEEVDKCFAGLKERLNSIDGSELDVDEAKDLDDAKEDIFHALNQKFGPAMAKQLVAKKRKVSGWNGFFKENYGETRSDILTENAENLSIFLQY